MKFDPRQNWRYPVAHEPPPCLVVGKGTEPPALSLLRQLGLQAEWVTKAPKDSPWVVKAAGLEGPNPVENALSAWRSVLPLPWSLEQGHWSHLDSNGWTTRNGPGRRLSAWGYPSEPKRVQTVLLLAKDWEDLNPWLDFAAQAGVPLLAAIDPQELAEVELADACAVIAHPAIVNQPHWLWLFSGWRRPGLVAAPMDLIHPEAFSNLVKHALWRAQVAKEQAAYRSALCSRETPLLARAASADLERTTGAATLRKQAQQVVDRLQSQLQQNLRWHMKIEWDGSWSLTSGEHCWRWSRHHQSLSYQEELQIGDIHFSQLLPMALNKPFGFSYHPWGFLPPSTFVLECEGEPVKQSEQEVVFDSLVPTPSPPLTSLSLVRTPPAIGFVNFGPEPNQTTRGWGLQAQAHATTIHLEIDKLSLPCPTLRDLPRVLLLVPQPADQANAVQQLERSAQMVIVLQRLDKTARMVAMFNPDWILCDPLLLAADERALEADLAHRAWWGSRMSSGRSATLPGNWREATHLKDFIDLQVTQPGPQPADGKSQKKIRSVIGQLQKSLEQSQTCHLQFLVNGGWRMQLQSALAHGWTQANYSWSPPDHCLRGEVLSPQGKILKHQADNLIRSFTEAVMPKLQVTFSALLPNKPAGQELDFGASRHFAAPPQKTSSGWLFTS